MCDGYMHHARAQRQPGETVPVAPECASLVIVDDDLAGIDLIIDYLRHFDFAIVTATGGDQGIDEIRRRQPDLVLLDVNMPPPNGFEVLRRLKRSARTRSIPVLLLTGRGDSDSKVRGFELGAADYVTKPVDRAELHARLTAHLSTARQQVVLERRLRTYQQRFGPLADAIAAEAPGPQADQQVEQLQRARQLLRERIADPPTLDQLAAELGISQPRLSRDFRALFGTSVFGYLREVRLQRARELLTTTTMPIKTIALEVGYRDPRDLGRGIKQRFGMTPSALRERL